MYLLENNFLFSSKLSNLAGITHAFTTRMKGDIRDLSNQKKALRELGLDGRVLVQPKQVHGTVVTVVTKMQDYIPDCDGIISINNKDIVLGVRGADCVPLLFVDYKAKIVGVAHAGWKGTLGKIAKNVITVMLSCGARQEDIFVSIGPRIGRCCYSVSHDRAELFCKIFENDQRIVSVNNGTWYLDLGVANYLEIVKLGIPSLQVDSVAMCTQCQEHRFFSYRRDGASNFAEQMGIIALNDL